MDRIAYSKFSGIQILHSAWGMANGVRTLD